MPKKPAAVIFIVMATAINNERWISRNHIYIATPVITAKIKPLNSPTRNSLEIILETFEAISSLVAIKRTVTVKVCVPAFPPMDATIGINMANATTFSILALKRLMTVDASIAVNKLIASHTNLFLVILNAVSDISSSLTPANLKVSSSASSFIIVTISSPVIIPMSLWLLSTTPAEKRLYCSKL